MAGPIVGKIGVNSKVIYDKIINAKKACGG